MDVTLPGPAYALLTALAWAVAVILFKRSGDAIAPVGLNMLKNVVGLLLFLLTMVATGAQLPEAPLFHTLALVGSGVVGIGIADSLYFHSLNVLGASRSAIVGCLYSPSIVVISLFMLGEVLSVADGIGAVLVVVAVVLAVEKKRETKAQGRELLSGVAAGVAAVLLMGVAIVAVKPILELYDVLWSTTVRMLGGVAVLALWAALDPRARKQTHDAFTPQRAWKVAIPGAVIGTYVALLLWIAGFKYNTASVAAILNQTSTVLVALLAVIFLRERFDMRCVLAVVLGVVGSVLVLIETEVPATRKEGTARIEVSKRSGPGPVVRWQAPAWSPAFLLDKKVAVARFKWVCSCDNTSREEREQT